MTESDEPRRRGKAIGLIVAILGLIVFYSLSIGPAYSLLLLADNPRGAEIALGIVYMPLVLICQSTGSEPLLSSYIEWWMELLQ